MMNCSRAFSTTGSDRGFLSCSRELRVRASSPCARSDAESALHTCLPESSRSSAAACGRCRLQRATGHHRWTTSIVSSRSIVQPARLDTGRRRKRPKKIAAAGSSTARLQSNAAHSAGGRSLGYSPTKSSAIRAPAKLSSATFDATLLVSPSMIGTV